MPRIGDNRPRFRHRFTLHTGEVLVVSHQQARRVIDKRGPQAPPETLWEITTDAGIVRRVWLDELRDWSQEPVA